MAHFIQTGPYSLHCFFLLLEFNRVLDNGIIIKDLRCHSHVSVSSSQVKTTGKQTSYLFFSERLCRHLVIHVVKNRYPGEQETHWDKTNKRLTSLKMVIFFVCLLLVRFLLTSITGIFGPREWLGVKGLLSLWTHTKPYGWFSLATEFGAVVERLLPSQKQNSNS